MNHILFNTVKLKVSENINFIIKNNPNEREKGRKSTIIIKEALKPRYYS